MFEDDIDAKYFIMIDADNTYEIANINKNLSIMKNENFDMMVAKRVHHDSSAYRKGYIFGNYFFSKFVSLIFGNDVTDIFSGFRIFSKDLLRPSLRILQNLRLKQNLLSMHLSKKLE